MHLQPLFLKYSRVWRLFPHAWPQLRICLSTVLRVVQSSELLLLRDTEPKRQLRGHKQQEGSQAHPNKNGKAEDEVSSERSPPTPVEQPRAIVRTIRVVRCRVAQLGGEQTRRYEAPKAAEQMYGGGIYHVVQLVALRDRGQGTGNIRGHRRPEARRTNSRKRVKVQMMQNDYSIILSDLPGSN